MPWNTFDRDREHLEAQYQDPAWNETSGWVSQSEGAVRYAECKEKRS